MQRTIACISTFPLSQEKPRKTLNATIVTHTHFPPQKRKRHKSPNPTPGQRKSASSPRRIKPLCGSLSSDFFSFPLHPPRSHLISSSHHLNPEPDPSFRKDRYTHTHTHKRIPACTCACACVTQSPHPTQNRQWSYL